MVFSSRPLTLRAQEKAGALEPGAALRLGELELREEWQDEEFPRLLPEEPSSSGDPEDPQRGSQAGREKKVDTRPGVYFWCCC